MVDYFTIRWREGSVQMLDQRLLPQEIVYLEFTDYIGVADAIRDMAIRGAPAIGAAAGYGLALAAVYSQARNVHELMLDLQRATRYLKSARPTAVNLFWAVDRIMNALDKRVIEMAYDVNDLREAAVLEALAIAEEDGRTNRQMARIGQDVLHDGARIIHHCNTGALATVEYGTALGVIRMAFELGKRIHVFVDETRPRLQGARLTSWELKQLGIPHTVIADGASGYVMSRLGVDLCLVGCDRVAANGDVANKIGTYNLALVAYAHGVPFYSVGPTTTIDMNMPSGLKIPIEERTPDEVTHIGNYQITPEGINIANPAFDVTPAKYVTGIITERGIARPPYQESLLALFDQIGDE